MLDNQVSRHQYGVTNERETSLFSDMPIPNPAKYHIYDQDFDTFVSGDWTNTQVGSGTLALVAGDGGIIKSTTTAGASDSNSVQLATEIFTLATGLRTWGLVRFSVDSLLPNLILGLVDLTTTPYSAITDGIWLSTATAGVVTVNIATASTTTSQATGLPKTVADLTKYATFAWYWDGGNYGVTPGRVIYELTGAGFTANYRGEFSAVASFPTSTVKLTPTFGVQNTTGVARNLQVDQMFVMKERGNVLSTPPF